MDNDVLAWVYKHPSIVKTRKKSQQEGLRHVESSKAEESHSGEKDRKIENGYLRAFYDDSETHLYKSINRQVLRATTTFCAQLRRQRQQRVISRVESFSFSLAVVLSLSNCLPSRLPFLPGDNISGLWKGHAAINLWSKAARPCYFNAIFNYFSNYDVVFLLILFWHVKCNWIFLK